MAFEDPIQHFEFPFLAINNNYWQRDFINNIWLFLKINMEPLWNISKKKVIFQMVLQNCLKTCKKSLKQQLIQCPLSFSVGHLALTLQLPLKSPPLLGSKAQKYGEVSKVLTIVQFLITHRDFMPMNKVYTQVRDLPKLTTHLPNVCIYVPYLGQLPT